MEQKIYLDNAATTQASAEVVEAMLPFLRERFGNPSGVYELAAQNKKALNQAREEVARTINCDKREIFFTSGGTESDNWVLLGAAEALRDKGAHIITSKIEHHAILHTCEYLERNGYEVTYLDTDEDGIVSPSRLAEAIRPTTILVSIMTANNEIGTIQPIPELAAIARAHGVWFHTDAVQAFGHIPIDVTAWGVDFLSASAHKLYGPKGVGCLYIRDGISLPSLMHGGAQERRRRAGTENVAGIVGFGKAAGIARETMEARAKRETELRDYLIRRILREIPYTRLDGATGNRRLPNNTHFCFQFIEGESLLIMLDMKGICASSGSACTSGSTEPSHVLLAIGLPSEIARGSLRLTLSDATTKEELDYTIDTIKEIVGKIRNMSPKFEEWSKKGAEQRQI